MRSRLRQEAFGCQASRGKFFNLAITVHKYSILEWINDVNWAKALVIINLHCCYQTIR